MQRTLKQVEAKDLQEELTVRLLGQDWIICEILEDTDGEGSFNLYLTKAWIKPDSPCIEVYDANVTVPAGESIPVYVD